MSRGLSGLVFGSITSGARLVAALLFVAAVVAAAWLFFLVVAVIEGK